MRPQHSQYWPRYTQDDVVCERHLATFKRTQQDFHWVTVITFLTDMYAFVMPPVSSSATYTIARAIYANFTWAPQYPA